MKILRIIHTMNPVSGGPCQGIRNIVPLLKQEGIDNEVLSMDAEWEIKEWNDPFPIHALGHAKSPWAYNNRLVPWLKENSRHYDLVIVHGLWLHHSFAAATVLAQQANSPLLWVMPHGMLDPYFQRAEGRKFKAVRNWIYWKLLESSVVNRADALLFTTQEELLLARTSFRPYRPKKELNIGYGVPNPPAYHPRQKHAFEQVLQQDLNRPYLLFLSRIHEKKGVDLLLKAYQSLKQQATMPDLIIAGPGMDTAYGRQLQSTAKQDAQIHFPGMLQGDAKWGAFYGCEAFVLPSHQENFGIAVVEALACGKPVLTTHQVNIWREIETGKAGLVGEDSLEGVYEQLKRWLTLRKAEKNQLGENAKETFQRYFSMEEAVRKMKSALKDYVLFKQHR